MICIASAIPLSRLNPDDQIEVWKWTVGTSGGWWSSISDQHNGQWFLASDIAGLIARHENTEEPVCLFPAGFNPNKG